MRNDGIYVKAVALTGIVSLIEHNTRRRERLLHWMKQSVSLGAHLGDPHIQAEAARGLFGSGARGLTLELASEQRSRQQIRSDLAFAIVSLAARVLVALREGGQGTEEVHRTLQSELVELGDLGELGARARACERTRMRPHCGFTSPEWMLLQEGPLFAVLHVSAAASNGPRELLREFREADNAILSSSLDGELNPVVGSAFHAGLCRHRLGQLADAYPSRRALLDTLRNCAAISEKAGVGARGQYASVVNAAMQAAAGAARERVLFSRRGALENERRALQEISRTLL